jgi:hypothetical protein
MIIVFPWQNSNFTTYYIWQNVSINNVNVQNCNVLMSMLQLQFSTICHPFHIGLIS